MALDLYSIEYLKSGSDRQKRAHASLEQIDIFSRLAKWKPEGWDFGEQPALAGSVPIDLALDDSDLDIVTFASDLKSFGTFLRSEFGSFSGFQSSRAILLGVQSLVTNFDFAGETYEIFTQNVWVPRQNAVLHLLIEERILALGGDKFRAEVWRERTAGLKTEPAFGKVLGLDDPYRELLELEDLSDSELKIRFRNRFEI